MKSKRPVRSVRARVLDAIADQIARRGEERIGERIAPLPSDLKGKSRLSHCLERPQSPTNREYVERVCRLLWGPAPEPDAAMPDRHPCAGVHLLLVNEFLDSPEFRALSLEGERSNFRDPAYFLIELENGSRFWVNLRDTGVSRGIMQGMWEKAETLFIRRHVKPGMNVLDIGANLGWFTVQMGRIVGPSGRVVAFEPRSDLFHYLGKTVMENGLENVVLFNCALGARAEEGYLHWAREDTNPGGSQLVPASLDLDSLREDSAIEKVRLAAADEQLDPRPVDFVKIDVEGAEKFVWDGARRILTRDRPLILSEVNVTDLGIVSQISAAEYLQYLKEHGYMARLIGPNGEYGAEIGGEVAGWREDTVVGVAFVPVEAA